MVFCTRWRVTRIEKVDADVGESPDLTPTRLGLTHKSVLYDLTFWRTTGRWVRTV